jgi:hypothetical protein
MNLTSILKPALKMEYLPIFLIAMMVMTRFHHFGDALHLPDASLAVFFFAGFFQASAYAKKALFVFLIALAGLIDYVAIANGTSNWCVSAAYVFLIPTYGVMWLAGRYCANFKALTWSELGMSMSLATVAISTAFVISSGSFYLLSGRFGELSLFDYAIQISNYYPSYLGAGLMYALVGLGMMKLIKSSASLSAQHSEI